MTVNNSMEVRFVELMSQLFQLDEAERLDFGIYRIIRRHNHEVKAFLGEVAREGGKKVLNGGKLFEIIQKAFAVADDEQAAGDRFRIKELERKLGLSTGMPDAEKEASLLKLADVPATKDLVEEYRSRKEHLEASGTAEADRMEVFNRLHQFFDRHYQDGDFIVERRYGKDGSRYIRSTGDDTEFHFATEDMYYIKSGDIFTDFPVTLSYGQQIVFTLDPDILEQTRAVLRPTDKAHYELHEVTRNEQGQVIVVLKYLKNAQTDKEKERIAVEVHKACGGESAEIKRWLNHFIARNQSDFFIHKRLKETLTEDLDIFIKTEVLDADQLMGGGDLPQRMIKVGRVVRQIGSQIINFLAVLEDFQRRLWEKKKLVFETRYVITLDRITALAGEEWLVARLENIIKGQQAEWKELGLGNITMPDQCRVKKESNLFNKTAYRWLPLPVDTANFDEAFKWDLLSSLTASHSLDESIDAVAIHSDNWQALNTLHQKYSGNIQTTYIDPPYNKDGDGFPYKDSYRHSSWIAMIMDRLFLISQFMKSNGIFFGSIGKDEQYPFKFALDTVFGRKNRVEEIIWLKNTNKNQSPTYSNNHEYVHVYSKNLDLSKSDFLMFREMKPGAAEILDMVKSLNSEYPSIKVAREAINALFRQHQEKIKEDLEKQGMAYSSQLDPWKGIFNYKFVEYRDASGKFVEENKAREKSAELWVWREDNPSMPNVSAGSRKKSVRDPVHPNYRFYRPRHPKTNELCTPPKRGWVWPKSKLDGFTGCFDDYAEDDRIAWGPDEKKIPQLKKFLHETETQVSKSAIVDYTDGEKELTDLTGNTRSFPNPKPSTLIRKFISQTTNEADWVMDIFAGSGTTLHSVLRASSEDKKGRKTMLIEGGNHFEELVVPRTKKLAASLNWKLGELGDFGGPGLFMRVQALEQYEDTLENLDTGDAGQLDFKFYDPAFTLRYGLNQESKAVYCSIGHFKSPFGYQLQRVEGGGKAVSRPVDLVESLVYLMGLKVSRMIREAAGVVITGSDPRNRSVAAFFRDCDHENSMAWVEQKLHEHPADRVVTNDPAGLHFEGCERFEAIESFFAGQFGGR